MTDTDVVLDIADLSVTFATPEGPVEAVRGVSYAVRAGECIGVVGESGSGKSQTVLAAMGLLAQNGAAKGAVTFKGDDILGLKPRRLNAIRGEKMTMIFQDPLTSLTPHMRVGDQLAEVLFAHGLQKRLWWEHLAAPLRPLCGVLDGLARMPLGPVKTGAKALADRIDHTRRTVVDPICAKALEDVRIPDAAQRLKQYPHELSGGMRQRVMIAMALLAEPDVLIADEPTTALDVTVQAQVLDILDDLRRKKRLAIVLITHDMGVIARMADRVVVMKDGAVVEEGTADGLFAAPQEPYTRMLLDAMPRLDRTDRGGRPAIAPAPGADAPIMLSADDLRVWFPVPDAKGGLFARSRPLKAVDGVDLTLKAGETLGVVGESGCGKSTLARAALRLAPITAGRVAWLGRDMSEVARADIRKSRKDLQIVFQDPLASLDPRMTVGASVAEPLTIHRPDLDRAAREDMVRTAMARCGLDPDYINRYPHELSGGQNQRVGIARAVILEPKIVVCDEAVSALDVSVQAQVLDLLIALQRDLGLAIIFISHDLSVVREVSHRVMVLYLGRVVELADRDTIYDDARHPYTKALMSAVPIPDPAVERARARIKLDGDLPSPLDPDAQFRFLKSRLTSEMSMDYDAARPQLIEVAAGHWVAEHDPFEGGPGLHAP